MTTSIIESGLAARHAATIAVREIRRFWPREDIFSGDHEARCECGALACVSVDRRLLCPSCLDAWPKSLACAVAVDAWGNGLREKWAVARLVEEEGSDHSAG